MNKITKESQDSRIVNGEEVGSSDLLDSIVSVEELKPGGILEKVLRKMVKKYGV